MDIRDTMISELMTPQDYLKQIARQVQAKRLVLNLSQKTLSERSGVSFGVLKKFERTGEISLKSLLKLALVLNALNDFGNLFKAEPLNTLLSLDDLVQDKTRKRGRQ